MAGKRAGSSNSHQLSPKAAQLHQTLKESLNEKDRANFARILDRYQRTNNIQRFVESLNEICTTPQQREEIYPLLRGFIPRKHRERFDYECGRPRTSFGRYYSRRELENARYDGTIRSLPAEFGYGTPSVDSGFGTTGPSSRKFETRTKRKPRKPCVEKEVVLERDKDSGEKFGFSIRGGAEHNIALFVSSIDEGSVAENAGLSLGDQIIEVNQTDCGTNVYHRDVVEVIQQASTLHLLVKPVGKIPGTYKSSSAYRWIDPLGNEVSPPAEYIKTDMRKSDTKLLRGDDERKVNLFVADGAVLGLKIRGGIEHGLGIFITSVDPHSGAQRAGFQVGDQILDVNGKSFLHISHMEAVEALKISQHMVVTLRDVGILPHGKKVREETKWIKESKNSPRPSSADSEKKKGLTKKTPSFYEPMGSSLLTHHSVADHSEDILKIKARNVLSNSELQAFGFYLEEYRVAHLSLFSFLSALSDLFQTPKKIALFQDIRSAILPRDLSKFDDWIDQKAEEYSQTASLNQEKNDDKRSLHSYISSASSNSWFRFLEEDDRQHLKSPSREKFDKLPDPPEDMLYDHSWEVASIGSRSSRARRAMPIDDFPPPPIFSPENETPLSSNEMAQKYEQSSPQRTVSPSDIQFEAPTKSILDHGKDTITNFFKNVKRQKSSPPKPREDTEDGLYEDVNSRESRMSPINDAPFKCTLLDRLENEHGKKECSAVNRRDTYLSTINKHHIEDGYSAVNRRDTNSSTIDDQHIEDGYSAVNRRDTYSPTIDKQHIEDELYTTIDNRDTPISGCGRNTFKTELINTSTSLQDDPGSGDNTPLYSVDQSKKQNKFNNVDRTILDENDIPPPVPDRLYLESFTDNNTNIDHNMNNVSTSYLIKDESTDQNSEELKNTALQQEISNELSKLSINERSNKRPEFKSSPEDGMNKKNNEEKRRNTGSTKCMKKSRKSKTNIALVNQSVDYGVENQPFVVELEKHSSNLGLSITGGTDTESKEIRIKSVKNGNTVAGSCPLLKPGQVILGVDGKSLQNVTSGIAAMAIRQAFHSDKTALKLILANDS